jgi:septation ring formation regulator EzrA
MLQLAKQVHAKFQISSFNLDGLRHIFDHFSSKFQNLFKKISKKINSEKKIQIEHPRIPKNIFYQNLSHIAFLQKLLKF